MVRTICPYCAVGCGVRVRVAGGRIIGVEGDPDSPVNRGMLCTKGKTLHRTVRHAERATVPLLRERRGAPLEAASWDTALNRAASRFAEVIGRHGPGAVAFYVSGQLLTEEYAVFNKLMKGFIGSNNIDSNSRLCMSSAVAGYKRAFGADGPPACYADIEEADTLFLFGANPAFTHPILFRRMEQAREAKPAQKLVVVDPRRTDSCSLADLHLALRPGTDVALLLSMLHVLRWEGLLDQTFIANHTVGFEAAVEASAAWTPRRAARLCDVDPGDIFRAALWFGAGRALSMWTMGFNQATTGVDRNNALINLHLATGQVGKPGCGPFSLTGQPNAMGGRETGGLANLLPGHRDLAVSSDRNAVSNVWSSGPLAAEAGRSAVELFRALESGEVKAVWIAATNPVVSLPDTAQARRALERAEFVAVSDIYVPTETTAFADVVFPAAGWGEKEGTMTNAERRVQRVRRIVDPPGEARPDWEIVSDFARRLGRALGADWDAAFGYADTAAVYDEHRRLLSGRDCDIDGLDWTRVDREGLQWPVCDTTGGTERLYADARFPTGDGRARFVAVAWKPPARETDARYPLVLTTGRYRDQWHTRTKTGRVGELNRQTPAARLEMHPGDAAIRGLSEGDLVAAASALGRAVFPLALTADIRRGVVFLPMHWGDLTTQAGQANDLIFPDTDPISGQPAYKHVPVDVQPARLPTRGFVLLRGDHVPACRPIVGEYAYGTVTTVGRPPVTRLEVAGPDAVLPSDADFLDARVTPLLKRCDTLVYADGRSGAYKRLWVDGERVLALRWLGTGPGDVEPLQQALLDDRPLPEFRAWIGGGGESVSLADRGPLVCTCLSVREGTIRDAIAAGAGNVPAIQEACAAGTSCGSCIPQLKRLLEQAARGVA